MRYPRVIVLAFAVVASLATTAAADSSLAPIAEQLRNAIQGLDSIHLKIQGSYRLVNEFEGEKAFSSLAFNGAFISVDEHAWKRGPSKRMRIVREWEPQSPSEFETGTASLWRETRTAFNGKLLRQLFYVCEPPNEPRIADATQDHAADVHRVRGCFVQNATYLDSIGGPFLENDAWRLSDVLLQPDYRIVGEESIDRAVCVIVECPDKDKLWLDKRRGFAVRKREIRHESSGQLRYRIHAAGHVQVSPGLWMPKTVEREVFLQPEDGVERNEVHFVSMCRLAHYTANDVADEVFEIEFESGTSIHDSTVLENAIISYRAGATQEQTELALDRAVRARHQRQKDAAKQRATWIAVFSIVAIGLAVGGWWWSYRSNVS